MNHCGLGGLRYEPLWGQDILCVSHPVLRPNQPPVQRILGASWGQSGWGAALIIHSLLVLRLKKEYIYILTPSMWLHGVFRMNFIFRTVVTSFIFEYRCGISVDIQQC